MTANRMSRDEKVFVFVGAHLATYGISPSYDEIGAATAIRSKSNITYIIDRLCWRGLLKRGPGAARNLQLVKAENSHGADCSCDGCNHIRYLADLKLVQALQVAPKLPPNIRLIGIHILAHSTRLDWLVMDGRRKPLLSRTKATNNPPHQNLCGAI